MESFLRSLLEILGLADDTSPDFDAFSQSEATSRADLISPAEVIPTALAKIDTDKAN